MDGSTPALVRHSAEVARALERRAPVVALETTIVAHGMPFPQNLETARAVESAVRERGAVPATIAVLDGAIVVGLSEEQLERVAREPMLKLGRSDLAFALSARKDGATTVAATMECAALAGILMLATGGIGGVHRGAEQTMDVSGDLDALASLPVAVVCAGAKAILDLPKTLEALETRGVPVVGYRTDEFPAFWSRSSGLHLALRCDSAAEIARVIALHRALGRQGGTVVANPIFEQNEIPRTEMEGFISTSLREAAESGVVGKALTPWLLERVAALTFGRSIEANVALVLSNARLAAEIAIAVTAP
jgi:pseudouridine-5'-phosphate glycosidase